MPGHACKEDDAAAAEGLSGDTDDDGGMQKTGTPEPTEAGGESLPGIFGFQCGLHTQATLYAVGSTGQAQLMIVKCSGMCTLV